MTNLLSSNSLEKNHYKYIPVDLSKYPEKIREKIIRIAKDKIDDIVDNKQFQNFFNENFFKVYINQNNFTEEQQSNSLQKSLPILSTLLIPFKGSQTVVFDNYKKTLECMKGEIIFKSVFTEIYGISRSNTFMYLNTEPELSMVRGVYEMNNKLYNNNQLIDTKYKTYCLLLHSNGESNICKDYEIDFIFPAKFIYGNEYTKHENIQNLINNYDKYDERKDEEKKKLTIKYLNILLHEEDTIDEANADTIKKGIDNIKNYLSTKEGKQKLEENLMKKHNVNKSFRDLDNYIQFKSAMDKLFKIHYLKKYPDLYKNPLRNELVIEMRNFYEKIYFASNNPMINGKQIDEMVDDDFIKSFSNSDDDIRMLILEELISEVDSKFIYRQAINKAINDFVNKEIDSDGNIVYEGFKKREELSKTDFAKDGVTSDEFKEVLKKALTNEVLDATYSFPYYNKYKYLKLDELPYKLLIYDNNEITEINEEFNNNLSLIGEDMNDLDFKERLEKVKAL